MNKARVERKTIQTLFGFNLKKNMGKMKNKAIDKRNSQKPEYMIIGSNNFWYASGLTSLAEARKEAKEILKNNSTYSDPETDEIKEGLPDQLYIYKAIEIDTIYI